MHSVRRKLQGIMEYIGQIVFDTRVKSGESGEGEGGDGGADRCCSSVIPKTEQVYYQPNLLVNLGLTIERWEDGVILVRLDDSLDRRPVFGLSVWVDRGVLCYTVDEPADL